MSNTECRVSECLDVRARLYNPRTSISGEIGDT